MIVADKLPISRRPFISGLIGITALAGIAALEAPRLFPKLFARRYPPTPYDDLFLLLPDRQRAVRVGSVLLGAATHSDARALAMRLRTRMGGHSLATAIGADLMQGRLAEAQGWLIPESVAELCLLAAIMERPGVRA